MWKHVAILFLLVVCLANCKGNEYSQPVENIVNGEQNNKYIAEVIPHTPLKIETDTILSNEFRVKIRYYSSNEKLLNITETEPYHYKKTLYRNFESDIEVYYKNRLVFEEILSKNHFNSKEREFLEKTVLQFVEIDQLATQKEKKAVIRYSFKNPQNNTSLFYTLLVNEEGSVELIKE